jgi:lipoprotein-anchoring transpeptidase ErfK/SrfK
VKKRMLVALVLAAVASGAAAPSAQRGGVVPVGVKVGGLKLGGLPVEQARASLAYAYNRPLHFVFYGKRWKVRPAALGSTLDVERTIKEAVNARQGETVPLSVTVDSGRVAQYSHWLDRWLSVEPQDATATLTSRLTPVLHPAKAGLQVRPSATAARIETALRSAVRPVLRPSAHTVPATITRQNFGPVVVIHRGSNRMYVFKGTTVWRTFPVATGQSIYPTPLGNWHVVDMQRNPWWRPPDSPWAKGLQPIPPGPGNPLGTRWMGLDAPGVGMHGTPDAASIGYSASHGCIRMYVPDAEWLFNQVHVGTPVFIVAA